jgi:hypothetical protein
VSSVRLDGLFASAQAGAILFISRSAKIGHRIVVIGGTAPASAKAGPVPPGNPPPAARRIVVIRNNELVGRGPGR